MMYYDLLEKECQKKFQQRFKNPRLLTSLRFEQELNIIKKRNLGFEIWFIYTLFKEFIDTDSPYSTRGSAGDSFILYLLGLTHYNPVENHLPAIFCYGTDSNPRPLSFCINLSEKDRKTAIETLVDMLKISIDKKKAQKARVIELILDSSSLSTELKTEYLKNNGTYSIVVRNQNVSADTSLKLQMYLHQDIELLSRLSTVTNEKTPKKPEKRKEIFSLFEKSSLAGFGDMDALFIREYVLDLIHPKSVSDVARLLGLAHSSVQYTVLQRPLLKDKTIHLTQTISSAEDIYHILRKCDYSEDYAYDLVTGINKHTRRFSEENVQTLLNHGIPEMIVNILKDVTYAFYAGQNYDYAWQILSLAYYKYQYSELFTDVLNEIK